MSLWNKGLHFHNLQNPSIRSCTKETPSYEGEWDAKSVPFSRVGPGKPEKLPHVYESFFNEFNTVIMFNFRL